MACGVQKTLSFPVREMMRLATGLICIIALQKSFAESKMTFDKSELISYADVNGKPDFNVDITKCADQPCQLFAVARDLTDIERSITLFLDKNPIINLSDLVSKNRPGYGRIQPFNLTAAPSYHIQNMNDPTIKLSPFYIYVVRTDADYIGTVVFDAGNTSTVGAPSENAPSTATILSAADYFTLRNYVTPLAGGVDVFTSGFDSIDSGKSKIFSCPSDREAAMKSITTVVGPIATVLCAKVDAMTTFSVELDLTDRRTTTFEKGATVVAMSPGFSGTGTNYPSELDAKVYYKFSLVKDYQVTMTVQSNTVRATENVTITASCDETTHYFSYGGSKSSHKETFDAHIIEVSWNHTEAGENSYFLIQFESSAVRLLPACVPVLLAILLRPFS